MLDIVFAAGNWIIIFFFLYYNVCYATKMAKVDKTILSFPNRSANGNNAIFSLCLQYSIQISQFHVPFYSFLPELTVFG